MRDLDLHIDIESEERVTTLPVRLNGLGLQPFKLDNAGSNPVQATSICRKPISRNWREHDDMY